MQSHAGQISLASIVPLLLLAALASSCSRRPEAPGGAAASAPAGESSRKAGALTDDEHTAGAVRAPGALSPEATQEARRMAEEEGELSPRLSHAMSGDVLADYCEGCATRVCGIAYLDCAHNPACADRMRGRGGSSAATAAIEAKYRAACDCIKKCANCAAKVSCP